VDNKYLRECRDRADKQLIVVDVDRRSLSLVPWRSEQNVGGIFYTMDSRLADKSTTKANAGENGSAGRGRLYCGGNLGMLPFPLQLRRFPLGSLND